MPVSPHRRLAPTLEDVWSYITYYVFFFQAGDGIRDIGVTGVQTCALPISGLVAYFLLRRHALPTMFYALAGAGPGLLLIVAEILTRTAGARVLDLAGKVSLLDQTVQRVLNESRLNSALVVLFAGAIVATIAYGRSLGPARDDGDETA